MTPHVVADTTTAWTNTPIHGYTGFPVALLSPREGLGQPHLDAPFTLGDRDPTARKRTPFRELLTGPVWSKLIVHQRFVHGSLTISSYGHSMSHVLLVEDDADLREVLGVAFSSINGWNVSSAATGRAALAELAGSDPSLVLCDVHLGDHLATDVMSVAVQSGIPTLVLTASRTDDALTSLIPSGVAGILAKPIDPHALCELSRDLVTESLAGGESRAGRVGLQPAAALAEDPLVFSFMAERRPRVARDAMNALSGGSDLSRADVHRLVGRLSMYGLHESAEALRDAEESMAIGRSAADGSVNDSIVRARHGLVEFIARS